MAENEKKTAHPNWVVKSQMQADAAAAKAKAKAEKDGAAKAGK